ncbi:hypothetical protein ABIB39_002893 [Mucilaginibacter sp. UYP27]
MESTQVTITVMLMSPNDQVDTRERYRLPFTRRPQYLSRISDVYIENLIKYIVSRLLAIYLYCLELLYILYR